MVHFIEMVSIQNGFNDQINHRLKRPHHLGRSYDKWSLFREAVHFRGGGGSSRGYFTSSPNIEVSLDELIDRINEYLKWYREKRLKLSLGGLSPR